MRSLKLTSSLWLLMLVVITTQDVWAQYPTPNMPSWHSKYWFYRWRLRNDFMVMGSGPGQSLVAESRNAVRKPIIKWADAMIMHGYYLTMLAIEHKILQTKGRYTDLKNNERELYYAIKAFERVDNVSETFYSSEGNDDDVFRAGDNRLPPDVNGYFFRDDVPPDFVNLNPNNYGVNTVYTQNYYHLTSNKTGIEYGNFNYSKSDYEGLWEQEGIELGAPQINNPENPIVDYKKGCEEGDYGLGEESQDQVIRLLLGFETIVKSIENMTYGIDLDKDGIDDVSMNFQEEAKRHTTNIIGRITGHFSGTKTVDADDNVYWAYPRLMFQPFPYWRTYNPRKNTVQYGDITIYMKPFQIVANALFTSNNDIGINSNAYAMAAITYNWQLAAAWNAGIAGYSDDGTVKMSLILNVISNSGGGVTSNQVVRHIYKKSKEKHYQGLYIPLYDYFWNWNPPSGSKDQERKEESYNYANLLLEMAPCVGPHNFGYTDPPPGGTVLGVFSPHQEPDGIPYFWNVPFLFDNANSQWDNGQIEDEEGNFSKIDEGWFAGVDYMLLYNLIYANNEGYQPLYHDLINRVIDYDINTDSYMELVNVSGEGLMLGAFENMHITGNIYGNNPVTVKALDYIQIDNGITDPSNGGSITYETGKITCGSDFTNQNTPYSIDQCTTCDMDNQMGSFIAPQTDGRVESNYLEMHSLESLNEQENFNREVYSRTQENGEMVIYPNPAADFFQIVGTEKLQQILLLDQNGSEIKQFAITDKFHDISDLSAGVYMLILKFNENETTHIKLVKL